MKKRLQTYLTVCLCMLLCSCTTDTAERLKNYEQQMQQLETALQEVTQQRDEVFQQLNTVQSSLETAERVKEELEEKVQELSAQVNELLYPPLQQSSSIRLFGTDDVILTDGQTEYIHFDRFCAASGMEFSADAFVLREWEGENYISLSQTAQLENLRLDETQSGVRFLAKVKQIDEMTQDVNVPVLMYHAVSDDLWGIEELFVKPAEMEKQLAWLVENDYDPIWFEDLSHLEDYDKPVLLTFDDGYDDNYTELYPLLQKYNVKATIFVIGKPNGAHHKMTEEQVTEMAKSGLVSIQSHTMTHGDLSTMNEKTLHDEYSNSCKEIGALTGEMPYVLCYPSGRCSELALNVAKEYFSYATKMNGQLFNTSVDNPYLISRYYIARETSLVSFAACCSGAGT